MNVFRYIKRLFCRKIDHKQVRFVAGRPCPECGGSGGLFHYDNFSMCEDCFTQFDENMIVKPKAEKEDEE